jgi:hypothetical protein
MAFALKDGARLSLAPTLRWARSRRGRLRVMLRTVQLLPPTGLVTLRFDAGRFPPTPAACYRAPWRLPGPDSHRLATTSFGSGHDRSAITPLSLGTLPRSVGFAVGSSPERLT